MGLNDPLHCGISWRKGYQLKWTERTLRVLTSSHTSIESRCFNVWIDTWQPTSCCYYGKSVKVHTYVTIGNLHVQYIVLSESVA
jgi:hypothetical protein